MPKTNGNQRITFLLAAIKEINSFELPASSMLGLVQKTSLHTGLLRKRPVFWRVRAALAYVMGSVRKRLTDTMSLYWLIGKAKSERFNLAAVKLFIDGGLEGETAALLSPYLHKRISRRNYL